MVPVLGYRFLYDLDDRVARVQLGLKGETEPRLLTYRFDQDRAEDFLAVASILRAGPCGFDPNTNQIRSASWMFPPTPPTEAQLAGHEVPFPW